MGASTAGLPAAYELREKLAREHQVTVVSNTATFQFVPSNPWVAVGWRTREQTTFPIAPYLARQGIEFVPVGVRAIHAAANQLQLVDGMVLDYDYLVIATGAHLAFESIPGFGPRGGFTQSVCTLEHAEGAWDAWQTFVADPGPLVVGAAQGASCFGPAYETAFIMDTDLRRRGIRDQVPLTMVTAEPYIGHFGLGGVGDSRRMLEAELRQRGIRWIANASVDHVREGVLNVREHDARGRRRRTHELAFDYAMLIPPFRGVPAVAGVGADLVDADGFVEVNEFQQNPVWANIYAVGVCIRIPPVEPTPVPIGTPKTGYMIESMVSAAVRNIIAEIGGQAPAARATWNAVCMIDMGDTGLAFVAMPQLPPRQTAWMKKGKWVRLAKVAFEKYFLKKMKAGATDPVYEKYILKAVGIQKLKSERPARSDTFI